MNTFRTFFLIIVSVIQISGIFTKSTWESLQLTEYTSSACKEVTHQASLKLNRTSLISKVQPSIVPAKGENLPVLKASDNSQQTIKKTGVISQIRFGGTVTAELF